MGSKRIFGEPLSEVIAESICNYINYSIDHSHCTIRELIARLTRINC